MVNRVIVYPAAVPQDIDLLNLSKFMMLGIGWLSFAILGACTTARVAGFACTATSPASLAVNVGPGVIYQSSVTDQNAYGSLGTDNTTIVKQGIQTGSISLPITPPTTSGFSIKYLIQAALQEADTGAQTLAFFNAANPVQPFSGPNNSGMSSNTIRSCTPSIALKASAAGTTPTAPTADSGFVGLWIVTVANGATSIVTGNITAASGAPFITGI